MKTEYNCFGRKYMLIKECKTCKVPDSCKTKYRERNIKKWARKGSLYEPLKRMRRREERFLINRWRYK